MTTAFNIIFLAPFVLAAVMLPVRFVQLCNQRGPCCLACGQPWGH